MIITVSRQVGSHGEDVGRAVASALDLPYFDNEIIARAARMANVSEQTIEQAERAPSLLTRMVEALGRYPVGFDLTEAASGVTAAPPLSSDAYRHLIEQVIHGLAHSSGAVILGHGGQIVLRGHPRAVHVFVCAPLPQRIRTVAAEEGITPEEAARRVHEIDQQRTEYFQRNYQVSWRDGTLYDLAVNTGRMRLGTAVDAVVDVVRSRER